LAVTCLPQKPHKEAGQGTLEFALIALFLVLIIFSVIDLGRAMSIYSFLGGAAQVGARAGATSSNNLAAIEAAAQAHMSGFDLAPLTISVNQSGSYTEVTLTYAVEIITPIVSSVIGTDTINLSNTARVRRLGGSN